MRKLCTEPPTRAHIVILVCYRCIICMQSYAFMQSYASYVSQANTCCVCVGLEAWGGAGVSLEVVSSDRGLA